MTGTDNFNTKLVSNKRTFARDIFESIDVFFNSDDSTRNNKAFWNSTGKKNFTVILLHNYT